MHRKNEGISGTRRRPIQVLAIETDVGLQLQLALILEDHGCMIRFVDSHADAEAALLDGIPDVVLCVVPQAHGSAAHTFAERLRSSPSTRHVGRVALADRVGWVRDTRGPFDAHVPNKPLDVPTLLQLVEQLSLRRRALSHENA